ncbi:hypothetical protein SAMN02745687_02023 [Lachnospiraceae bacterium NK3A20]|nr:hypothetical protein SAMN02745687_02023 [Lachnospiraceae bacterium NK3A20]
MFGIRKKTKGVPPAYDREVMRPVLHCSICNGEQVAGFQDLHTKEFREVMFIRSPEDMAEFRAQYGIPEDAVIEKIY